MTGRIDRWVSWVLSVPSRHSNMSDGIHLAQNTGMSTLLILLILLLVLGGGGFYAGGARVGGSLGGLILLVLIVMALTGRL